MRCPVSGAGEIYDWEGDTLPRIPYEQCVIYHIHPRGFTRHASSGGKAGGPGTFKGVADKIPLSCELGHDRGNDAAG